MGHISSDHNGLICLSGVELKLAHSKLAPDESPTLLTVDKNAEQYTYSGHQEVPMLIESVLMNAVCGGLGQLIDSM